VSFAGPSQRADHADHVLAWLRDKDGRVGHVQWRRLRDRDTGRLLLGYGHCLTVDSAQGITSGEHINVLLSQIGQSAIPTSNFQHN